MNLVRNLSQKIFPVLSAVALSLVLGCSESSSDSSPASPIVDPESSASLESSNSLSSTDVTSSAGGSNLSSSTPESSVETSADPLSSASGSTLTINYDPAAANLAVAPDEDGFYDMGDVYKAVPQTSKIAFVIRHSKRQKSTDTESQLTPIGIQMAQTLGSKLVGEESFHYASTDFVRTRATCENIAIGRGESNVNVETWDGINGGYFLTVPSETLDELVSSRGGNPKYIAQYAYGAPFPANLSATLSTYFYDLYERGAQFVNEVIVPNMPNWNRVSILVSHDMLVEPLIAYVSDRTINLKIYESPFRWVNYLSGIAVIVDEAGVVTVLPVRGDTVGWMIPSQEVDEST